MKILIFVFGLFASFVFAQDQNQKFVDQFDIYLQCDKYEKRLFGLAGEKYVNSLVVLGLIENDEKTYYNDVLQEYAAAALVDVDSPSAEIRESITTRIDSITAYQVNINRQTLSGTFAGRNLKCKKVSKKQFQKVLNYILDLYDSKFKDNKI